MCYIKCMKTKMPDTIYLFPTYYEVGDTVKHEDDGYSGRAIHVDRKIRVDLSNHPEEQKSVMLHEIVHAILTQSGFQDHNEMMIEVLANGFLNIIRGNKDLIKWLEEVG